ncbi:MAG TPA: putative Ig domain-containing protein [Oscillospiraceae bacterium]|nr:putative Ig domain-containing protein [Oscillospiraceae bacterium]HPF54961.1 putative Ig domain-containing protein [Clostridiales bacterium]HPK34374.1 putative Ig domain-containing protein [Oscillospiraceae bacterium]HPR75820.1 putative Ig domain-containing protein [Oscillospiraceae bacterium]
MSKPTRENPEKQQAPATPKNAVENSSLCADAAAQQYTETLTTDSSGFCQYRILTQTTIDSLNTSAEPSDPPAFQNNLALILENPTATSVKVNALTANGCDFSSLPGLLKTVCGQYNTDREKALALWQFLRQYLTFGITWPDQDFRSPDFSLIRFLNGFGSGACGSFNGSLALLAAAAGIPTRTGSLSDGSHAVTELFFDGKSRYFDALYPNAGHLFKGAFILDEIGEVASHEQLCLDSFLTRRAGPVEIGELASLFGSGDHWRTDRISSYTDPRDMSFTLQPGQQLVFYYNKFIGEKLPHQNLVSGEKRLLGAACSHALKKDQSSYVYWDDCPWPITGLYIHGKLNSGQLAVFLHASGKNHLSITQPGEFSFDFKNVCNAFAKTSHHCTLIIESADADFKIDEIKLLFQVCRPSLPALRSGKNTLELRADPNSTLKITHICRESAVSPPTPPKLLSFIPGQPFRWKENGAAEYEFLLSDRADFAWPYAPIFHQRVTKPELTIDPSLILPPLKSYFWRVRGKTADGIWSTWSEPESFIWDAPPIPADLELIQKDRKLFLRWQPAGENLTYAVYGSDEDGFTPSHTPYEVWAHRTDSPAIREIYPANLICITPNTELELTQADWVYGHYRIRAINAAGIGGLPTPCVALPHPFILENSIQTTARVGSEYAVYVKAVRSLGKLFYNRLPDKPMYTGFHHAQRLTFSIQGPAWLQIRDYDGYLHGTPTSADKGINNFMITVADQNGEKDIFTFDITVTEAAF